ncbi:DUF72 domain-containing protein [Mycobacterium sp. CPCC 205372]|uniref:DUF72 domain-containing protein n=1 Tax=Mycobacterium hippophais TaxID=3016340 RepID=A0ABT4PWS1_9MYCO|nr:DUF72 domain-containing protein [Mycobacterium hippophais]MCZ8381025.1 DUF72 domain-containing protein [Mycobacterium hippophais]
MIRIGTSGWSYDHWAGVLYPPKLPVAKRLAHYVAEFDTVELNASFYRWPRDATFEGWRQRLPDGFTMTVKAHRGLTHYRRLASPEPWVERFERCWTALGDKSEALLVQLHPGLARDDDRLGHFLTLMPDRIPVAMELRHPSWNDDAVFALLERHRAAYVVMSGPGMPCVPRATSDRVYVRLHGPEDGPLYAASYSDDALRLWADRIAGWAGEGRRVVVYFNNDLGGHAVRNARRLRELLRERHPDVPPESASGTLRH